MRLFRLVMLLAVLLYAVAPCAAGSDARAEWSSVELDEQAVIRGMLASQDWPFRAMALARLDRFQGDDVRAMTLAALTDDAWQVRCFAMRQARVQMIELTPEQMTQEKDPRVLRSALRLGFAVPPAHVDPITLNLLAKRTIDDLMLGIELAAVSSTESVRADGEERLSRLIQRMDDSIAALVAGRLIALLDLPRRPETADDFRALLRERGGKVKLPSILPGQATSASPQRSLLAEMDPHVFARLRDYLGSLRQRDLDLVLVMDATSSMIPMINEARAGVDALILFMNELSRSMRLAFVAYRDHDNEPVWEGERFTNNINTIRDFLFKLRITGGADLPEAVCDGICACRQLDWRRDAQRMIVLIGDAPYHADDESKLFRELEWHAQNGTVVHTVHVPMAFPRGFLERLPMNVAAQHQLERDRYNTDTSHAFGRIAAKTNGQSASLADAHRLVPTIMHFTIEPQWHEAFDEFYRLYLEQCR